MAHGTEAVMLSVGIGTYQRGLDYARSGAVREMAVSGDGHKVLARVVGSARQAYSTMVDLQVDQNGTLVNVSGVCSCPVSIDCKHVAAVAITVITDAAGRPESAIAGWERSLDAILESDESPSGRPSQATGRSSGLVQPSIGLQFEMLGLTHDGGTGGWSNSTPQVALRPVKPGVNGRWVRSGLTWMNLRNQSIRQSNLGDLVFEISLLGSSPIGGSYYHSRVDQPVLLGEVSARVWDVLADAQAAGLPMVDGARKHRRVRISTEPAQLTLEATRSPDGMLLRPRIRIGDDIVDPNRSTLVGRPAHGIAVVLPNDPEVCLLLAPFSPRLTRQQHAAAVRTSVIVPANAEASFLERYYPRLSRSVAMSSPDGSVELPEPQAPTLRLTVRPEPANHLVRLAWEWIYRVGDDDRTEPLHPADRSSNGQDVVRDPDAEAEVLTSVEAAPTVPSMWQVGIDGSRLAATATLGPTEAVALARDVLPALRALDHVDVVADDLPDYREAVDAPVVRVSADTSLAGNDWLELDVTITVDGQDVPFDAVFVALAQGQETLVLPDGMYFPLGQPVFTQLAALIAEARALQDRPDGPLRIHPIQASLWDELNQLGVVTTQAAHWQRIVAGLVEQVADGEATSEAPPDTLVASLRPYQQAGYDWLRFRYDHGLGAVLADDMGLGKTIQTLALICHAAQQNPAGPFLVVAPTSVVGNWAHECTKFAPSLRVTAIEETTKRRGEPLADVVKSTEADIVVTSYALFRLDFDEYDALPWAGLVLDEAQFVKNHNAKAYGCAKRLTAPFKLAVTGTPMENNLMELWALMSIVAPGLLASPQRFTDYYRTPIERGGDNDLFAQLRRRIRPLMLRRTKEQVAPELPPKLEQVVELDLSPRHRQIYQTHLQRERQKVLGLLGDVNRNRIEILRSLTLLRQLSLDPALVDDKYASVGSAKLDALMEHVDEIVSGGHRVLVFSQFTGFLARARARLDAAGVTYCYLDGTTTKRAQVLEEFRSGIAPVFLISLKAGGFGLNLTEADYCILLDPWWNPAAEAQAVDRTHRIGQTKTVMVYRFVALETIETKVMELKAAKAKLFTSLMEGTEMKRAGFTEEEIRELLA